MTAKPRVAYVFSMDKITNQASAYNYLTLFNPSGSGKVIVFGALFISSTLLTSSSITDSLRGFRISTATGGTLQADSAVGKFDSNFPDPAAEVRTVNPTVTLGPALFNSPAPITDKAAPVHIVEAPPGATFLFRPGEGLVVRSAAGIGTGATWNLSVAWAEVP